MSATALEGALPHEAARRERAPSVTPRVVDGAELGGRRTISVDVCVVGSGAGGGPVAAGLAEAGLEVAVLEEGGHHPSGTLTARPRDMSTRLYRDGGQVVTVGTPPIVLPLGRGVGGTTLVNSGTCFRTPAAVLDRWRSEHGLEALDATTVASLFTRVEEAIGVRQVTPELAGDNAAVVRRGAEALGVSGRHLFRNARGCVGSGVCAFGCPSGAKQHAGEVFAPRAWAAGATTYTGCRAARLEVERGAVRAVVAHTAAGGRLTVRARHTVLACGALLTPLVLRRHGIGTASGALGRHLTIHPASAARALMDDPLDPWRGVPQSFYVDELADAGILLEGIAGPPDQAAMATPGQGEVHRARMLDVRRWATFGVMVADSSSGSVRAMPGRPGGVPRPLVRYDLAAADAERFRRGFALLARIFFAAGAREVLVPVAGIPPLRDGDTGPLDRATIRPRDVKAMAFHPLGTARMGADPRRSVVDPDLAVHGVAGLHVADGSVLPTSPQVNPQLTIMALATRLADHLSTRG
ncbi:GMC family oxidoreductase [Conexibacter sp. SYSU D00693]|uniref:GMC family oxidoreductase n=1 Tax=Conexibacter sp. SYSU D00693 TaxID=2812560 RepID=UPI00196B6E61|nr:GMC family oxidoreductase [Conexibacter sp. SYSU D00693]